MQETIRLWHVAVIALFFIVPFSDWLTGLQYFWRGTEIPPISVSGVCKGLILIVAGFYLVTTPRLARENRLLLFPIGILAVFCVINGLNCGGIAAAKFNVYRAMQSFLLLGACIITFRALPRAAAGQTIWRFLWGVWFVVTANVMAGVVFHIGSSTYSGGMGTRAFLNSGNIVTYLLVSSSWLLAFGVKRNLFAAALIIVVSAFLAYKLGTKGGALGLAICVVWQLAEPIFRRHRRILIGISVAAIALIVANRNFLFLHIVPYLPYHERIESHLNAHDDDDLTTVILSNRDSLATAAISVMKRATPVQQIFGLGSDEFEKRVATELRYCDDRRMTELDAIDLFGTGGLLFVVWFYSLFLMMLVVSSGQHSHLSHAISGCAIYTCLTSIFSGHVALCATPLMIIACMYWLTFPPSGNCEESPRQSEPSPLMERRRTP